MCTDIKVIVMYVVLLYPCLEFTPEDRRPGAASKTGHGIIFGRLDMFLSQLALELGLQ